MEYQTHAMSLIVKPKGETIFSEMATTVRIESEGDGCYVEVEQSGRTDLGKIAINPGEWPAIRDAIDRMFAVCAEIDASSGDGHE
jgi:hypothetical protein